MDSEISTNAVCELLRVFEPLLRKYARLLEYTDAYFDLRAALLAVVNELDVNKLDNKTDGAAFKYIQTTIYHRYLALAKAQRRYGRTHVFFCELEKPTETGRPCLANVLADPSPEDELSFINRDYLRQYLNETEYEIILLNFYYGYSITEIAQGRKVSRQYVNRQKLKALQKLKNALLQESA